MSRPTSLREVPEDRLGSGVHKIAWAILVVAAILRFWDWGSVGIDHFDEGAYAMSARAVAEDQFASDRYPLQQFLSPPFQFGVAGLLMKWLGESDGVLIAVSAALGVATVALVYLVTARWLGPAAAMIASSIVATANFHILFSRSGLTDVAFGFWFVGALWLFAEADRRSSWIAAILAGLATGVAWNTKYHGWLAIVVAAMAILVRVRHATLRELRVPLARVVLAACIAAILYLPWATFVSSQPGGYAALTAEHAQYLRPWRALQQARYQIGSQLYLDGWAGRLGLGMGAFLLVALLPSSRRPGAARRAGIVSAAGMMLGASLTAAIAALFAIPRALERRDPGARMALCFFAAFLALTPLYFPYARLVLPLFLASAMLGGWCIAQIVVDEQGVRWPGLRVGALAGLLATAALGAAWFRPPWQSAGTFGPKDGFRLAAAEVARGLEDGASIVVWGEPGVVFYLRDRFEDVVHVDDLRSVSQRSVTNRPVYLVTSRYARVIGGEQGLEAWMSRSPGLLTRLSTVPVRNVSDVRLLDDYNWAGARRFRGRDVDAYDLQVFRVNLEGSR